MVVDVAAEGRDRLECVVNSDSLCLCCLASLDSSDVPYSVWSNAATRTQGVAGAGHDPGGAPKEKAEAAAAAAAEGQGGRQSAAAAAAADGAHAGGGGSEGGRGGRMMV